MSRDADPKIDPKATQKLFDKRTVERNIKKGLITRKDHEKHIKTLEDVAGKGLYGGLEGRDDGKDEADEGDPAEAPAGE